MLRGYDVCVHAGWVFPAYHLTCNFLLLREGLTECILLHPLDSRTGEHFPHTHPLLVSIALRNDRRIAERREQFPIDTCNCRGDSCIARVGCSCYDYGLRVKEKAWW